MKTKLFFLALAFLTTIANASGTARLQIVTEADAVVGQKLGVKFQATDENDKVITTENRDLTVTIYNGSARIQKNLTLKNGEASLEFIPTDRLVLVQAQINASNPPVVGYRQLETKKGGQ